MDNKKNLTPEEIASFLSGNDPQERIVNIECSNKDNFVTVYYRDINDIKHKTTEPFYPFVWAKKSACLKLCDGNKEELRKLLKKYCVGVKQLYITNIEGEVVEELKDGYMYMFYAKQPMSYSDFLKFFKEAKNPVYSENKNNNQSFTDVPASKKESRQYLAVTAVEQFMISTGKRMFKGYDDYDDILRLIFDLESTGLDTKKDRIEQFGIRFNRPVLYKGQKIDFEKIFEVIGETEEEKNASELKNIENFLRVIYTFQPDVITAHNGETFDWNLIVGACERLGTSIEEISSKYFNGKPIYKDKKETVLKLGGEIEKYNKTIVPGIVITDSLHAVRRAQAIDSNMLFSNLKYVTKYSKIVKPDRVYVPGNKISEVWNDNTERYAFCDEDGDWYIYDESYGNKTQTENKKGKTNDKFTLYTKPVLYDGYRLVSGKYIVSRYLLDDLWECDKVEHRYNTPNFLICKMLPVPFQKCCTMGTAGQWKSLMMAWSYENNLAIPNMEPKLRFTGGLSRLLKVGFVDNVVKLDYNSLYPSIILTWGINNEKDLMGAMLAFLEHVLTQREKYKDLKKSASKKADAIKAKLQARDYSSKEEGRALNAEMMKWKEEESANDKKQLPLKILGNSFFGSYGATHVFPWGSIDCAERVTCTGRQSLRLMISWFNHIGYEPIVGDTDGFNFKLPDKDSFRYTDDNPYISTGLSRVTEKGKAYTGFKADVAEFNDLFMRDFHYSDLSVNKMGLGIDEVVESTINFSRKNYADHFPDEPFPEDVKLVGNTIKSKKMPEYISKFLEVGIRLLLKNKGQEFLNEYYSYIDKIYNYQIPIQLIASKGKVKKTINEYKEDCKTITKAGNPKARQAWMELAIKENLNVNVGETIYYINTGKSKSNADTKKVTHFYVTEGLFNDRVDKKSAYEKIWKADATDGKAAPESSRLTLKEYVKKHYPEVTIEDEIILCCSYIPQSIIDSEEDVFCEEGNEYNVPKYISQFNKRITPLLVCFSPEIRNKILINNPDEKPYFTSEECKLSNGHPNKPTDQDTFEQLMTMDDKEIRFWMKHPEWDIPFINECGMDWEKIKNDYIERMEHEKNLGIDKIRQEFYNIIGSMNSEDFEKLNDGELPGGLTKIVTLDPATFNFVSKEYPDIVIGTFYDVIDAQETFDEEEFESEE